ncbi:MAG TPA: heme-binding protein [Acidobacteriaceae bacterium]|nr:heme-binding protein [Acidobacteriaceae bacterium]
MADQVKTTATIAIPTDFEFGAVPPIRVIGEPIPVAPAPPPLGPLAAFIGEWIGGGFNTIFRPDSGATPTPMPGPITTTDPADNVLELNLTSESLTFSPSLGTVPNRGSSTQADISLNGVPYLQTIKDVTIPTAPVGIHAEPGLWMAVPATTAPQDPATVVRMGSIPHGTTIEAQGTSTVTNGPPNIPAVDITPFFRGQPGNKVPFQNQDAANQGTRRIPQNLSVAPFSSLTIAQWQAMITDPNSVLRNAIKNQTIKSTTTISISTTQPPVPPAFGGGTDNIAFLQGDATGTNPNAQSIQLTATFWIEEVEHTILVPISKPGQTQILKPQTAVLGLPTPTFSVSPPIAITTPRTITFTSAQIQYSQTVLLNFGPLSWPHVSVATLVPASPITVPPSVWG